MLLKIVDFGSAYCIKDQLPIVQSHKWDIEFAAPELLIDPASPGLTTDIWSCAVLVYVLLRYNSKYNILKDVSTISLILLFCLHIFTKN